MIRKFIKKDCLSKGFTLIELLVVIAVLGVLAAGVLTAINPLQRIRQANDARAKNDIGQVVQALQAYYTTNQGYPAGADYAALTTILEGSKDLKKMPSPPTTEYTYTYRGTAASAIIYTTILAPKDTAKPTFCWDSENGILKESAAVAASTSCP